MFAKFYMIKLRGQMIPVVVEVNRIDGKSKLNANGKIAMFEPRMTIERTVLYDWQEYKPEMALRGKIRITKMQARALDGAFEYGAEQGQRGLFFTRYIHDFAQGKNIIEYLDKGLYHDDFKILGAAIKQGDHIRAHTYGLVTMQKEPVVGIVREIKKYGRGSLAFILECTAIDMPVETITYGATGYVTRIGQ